MDKSTQGESFHIGDVEQTTGIAMENLVYDNVDEEPAIHLRTWIALASMFIMNFVQTFALQGPPAVVSKLPYSCKIRRRERLIDYETKALVHRHLPQ
jgi:hypothetical protein